MAQISTIEGIGPAYAERLKQAGVTSTELLLKRGESPKGRKELAQSTGIGDSQILRWVNHADLFRVKGIGAQFAELLEAAGVDSVPELARRNASTLHQSLVAANQARKLARRSPTASEVEAWIAHAGSLPRAIQY